MNKLLAVALALTAMVSSVNSSAVFAEGLALGTPVGAFYVKDVTGPAAGEKLCYRCRYGSNPTVSIFTKGVDENVTKLIGEINTVTGKNDSKNMKSFVVLLTEDVAAAEKTLKDANAKVKASHTPLTTFDGLAGPASYKLDKDAEVTVMMWVDNKLAVNKTFKAGELNAEEIAAVVGQTKSILN